jgi:predicted GNAT superfamily acetyltransferase
VITVRHLSGAGELDACVQMQRETWGADWVVPYPMLLVAQKTGGVLAGAFDDDNPTLLGFVFGMAGLVGGETVHWSDMLAVRADARNRGIGRALKAFQRDTVRAMGITTMYWTYDPQVARNAHLNLNVLGAQVTEYVPDMYGPGTDRFIVRWSLDGQAPPSFGAPEGRLEIPATRAEFERAFAAGLRVSGFDRTHYTLARP